MTTARILLLEPTEAGILLLSYRPARYCPTYRQDLAPIRLRNDPNNPSCRYAYDPVAGTVLLPHELISSVPIRLWNPNTSLAPYCYPNLIRSRANIPTEPALALYCHRQVSAYDYEYCTAPIRTCQDNTTLHRTSKPVYPPTPMHDIRPYLPLCMTYDPTRGPGGATNLRGAALRTYLSTLPAYL